MDETKEPGLKIGQVFLMSAHFEHREDSLTLPADTKLEDVNVEVQIRTGVTEDGTKGLVAVGVRSSDDRPLYKFHVEMVALIEEDAATKNLSVAGYLGQNGAAMLYPFVREIVANLTLRGRFGPIWLKPFNVVAAMAQAVHQEGQIAQPKGPEEDAPGPS